MFSVTETDDDDDDKMAHTTYQENDGAVSKELDEKTLHAWLYGAPVTSELLTPVKGVLELYLTPYKCSNTCTPP